jgi:hypothetical protein
MPSGARRTRAAVRARRGRVLAALALSASLGAPAAPAVAAEPVVEYARDAGAVVLRYTEVLGEIGEKDHGPSLTVFGDGRVLVHHPRYATRAGDYTVRLRRAELDRLMRSLAAKGVADFDEPAARDAKRARLVAARHAALSAPGTATLSWVADASTTVIEMQLERYVPAAGGPARTGVHKRIAWNALSWDAARHPDIAALQGLAAAEQELRALFERPDLVRVP